MHIYLRRTEYYVQRDVQTQIARAKSYSIKDLLATLASIFIRLCNVYETQTFNDYGTGTYIDSVLIFVANFEKTGINLIANLQT